MTPAPSRKHQRISAKLTRTLDVFLDENGKFHFSGMYAGDDKIPVPIFNGDLKIDLPEVFQS